VPGPQGPQGVPGTPGAAGPGPTNDVVILTQAEYDALPVKDPDVLYAVVG
jgi:hypothetical protein